MTDRENQNCQGFYEVSGYTTDDGKKVDSYTRRCWKHGNGVSNTFIGQMPLGQINNTNSTVNNTENKVNEFTKFVENILKQKEVSNENIDFIKDNFIDIINNLCNSIEHLSVKKSKLPENPTLESVEELKNIDKERKQVYETTHKAIVTTNLAKSVLEKSFKSVDTKDKDYHKKLYEHIHNKEKLKKISNSLMELFDISSSINKNSIFKVNKIKEALGINNITYNDIKKIVSKVGNKVSVGTSESIINSIFNLSGSIPISRFNSFWGQKFWLYSKGQIGIETFDFNKNNVKEYKSVNDIQNPKLREFTRKKIKKELNEKDCRGITFFSNSLLSKEFIKSKDLQIYLKNYFKGKADDSIHFQMWKGFNYFSTLGYAEVYYTKELSNGDFEIVLVDTYDFNKDSNMINKMGYKVQISGISKPFFTIIYIHVPKKIINITKNNN